MLYIYFFLARAQQIHDGHVAHNFEARNEFLIQREPRKNVTPIHTGSALSGKQTESRPIFHARARG